MIVALGTFEPNSQEETRGAGGEVLRLAIFRGDERKRGWFDVLGIRPIDHHRHVGDGDSQQTANDRVKADAVGELLAKPNLKVAREERDLKLVFASGSKRSSQTSVMWFA